MHLPVLALTFAQLKLRHVISNPVSACPFPPERLAMHTVLYVLYEARHFY